MWLENNEHLERNAIRSGLGAGMPYQLIAATARPVQVERRQTSPAESLVEWVKGRLLARG